MAAIAFDLNEPPPPELDLNQPIDWIGSGDDWDEGPPHELDYQMVSDDGDQGRDNGENGDGGEEVAEGEQEDEAGLEAEVHAGDDEQVEGGLQDQVQDLDLGENVRKRRYYSDELKIAIYLELSAKTDPPVLHRGVSKQVALKFGVPLRLVQHIWQNGKENDGVVNKLFKNVGRKRTEIDLEAIKDMPWRERATLRDLADALGVKKTTLHNRLKEVKFCWR